MWHAKLHFVGPVVVGVIAASGGCVDITNELPRLDAGVEEDAGISRPDVQDVGFIDAEPRDAVVVVMPEAGVMDAEPPPPDSGVHCAEREVCDNDEDDDCDGATDWEDADCAPAEALAFGPAMPRLSGRGGTDDPMDAVESSDVCPDGRVVMGLRGQTGTNEGAPNRYIAQVAVVCGTPRVVVEDADDISVTVEFFDVLPGRGLAALDMEPFDLVCDEDEVMVGFDGRSGLWLDQLEVLCAPLEVTPGMDGRPRLQLGAVRALRPVGGTEGTPFGGASLCTQGVATGFDIIHSSAFLYVWRLHMYCRSAALDLP